MEGTQTDGYRSRRPNLSHPGHPDRRRIFCGVKQACETLDGRCPRLMVIQEEEKVQVK